MIRVNEIRLPLDHGKNDLHKATAGRLGIDPGRILKLEIARQSIDARKRENIRVIFTVDVEVSREDRLLKKFQKDSRIQKRPDLRYRFPCPAGSSFSRPVIIGSGPAGYMAALTLARAGYRPLVLERGKNVRDRSRDTFGLWRSGTFHSESNVQFGEGGAGTFSDGKLNSQIKDHHFRGRKVLEEFVQAGAPEEILYLNRPHIGTYRLVGLVKRIRKTIEELGGEVRFESRVDDFEIENSNIRGLRLKGGEFVEARAVVLAIGHSARDTFERLYERGVRMEARPFSVGFRIEHPQSFIDRCRYGSSAGHPLLGAAEYKLVHHCTNGRTVYSFCMCPGGSVVAATSEKECVVTNGMSQYSRNERNANSGIVVEVFPSDFPSHPGREALAGIEFQRELEKIAFRTGGSNYHAPAQLVGDFLAGRPSPGPGSVEPSYKPGVRFTDLSGTLPPWAIESIREALPAFEKTIPGFCREDAVLTGVETRTSSPVRIPRHPETLESENVKGLFPAGEGAGYAGGIFSAAVDGIRAAEAAGRKLLS